MTAHNLIKKRLPSAVVWGVIIFGWAVAGWAQTPLNVTNYGAKGDLLTLNSINTVSNSTLLVCPGASFVVSDSNKLIEVFGAGTRQGQGNQDLFARITKISSPSNITISVAAGATAANLTGLYGTDCYPAFTNAIAQCPAPSGSITIPSGNYFLLPPDALSINGHSASLNYTLNLNRGGITFIGQGNAVLTGMGGWVNYNNQGVRSALFAMTMPMTNNYPLVFTNLTFDGGVSVGNIKNLSYPASGSTGLGWDGTHHWMITVAGQGAIISSLVMQNCVIRHWRGEMMEDTSGSPSLYLTATNCFFYDGDGSCINNFAHNCVSCTFSNVNQAEEFYRTYTTNVSVMANSLFVNMSSAIALNGGYYGDPNYIIIGNTFTNGTGYALLTTPACDVLFVSNNVSFGNGIALGAAGYQGTTINSNIVVAWNTFNGAQYPLQIFGNGVNSSQNVYFFSNQVNNAWGIGSGYGWSTNVFVTNNLCSNVGRFYMQGLSGQYFYEHNNNYSAWSAGGSPAAKNMFTYANGSLGQIVQSDAGSIFYLDDTQPGSIPSLATITITNAANKAYPLYASASLSGSAFNVNAGQSLTFYWNGTQWVTSITPVISAINADVSNLGTNPAVLLIAWGTTVKLSASTSIVTGDNLAWQWSYSLNGGPQIVSQSGTGSAPASSFTYSVDTGGNTYVWTLQVTDTRTGSSTQSQFAVFVQLQPPQGLLVIPN